MPPFCLYLALVGIAIILLAWVWGICRVVARRRAGINQYRRAIEEQKRKHKKWIHLRDAKDEAEASLPWWAK